MASLARSLGLDAGELEPSVDPPAPAGDLKGELAAFTTVDACVAQRAASDPLVGDALEAIGYDTLVGDACRLLDAAKAKDGRRCAGITASALQARCEASAAELAGDPEACPFDVSSHPERGRDATCLALATRTVRLCDGVFDAPARATCEALSTHDAAPCKRLTLGADRARCARDVARWGAILPAAEAPEKVAPAASGKATLTGDAGALASGEFALEVSRGVVVLERMDGARFVVGSLRRGGPSFIAASPSAPKTLGFEAVVPMDPKKAHLETLELDVPGRSPVALEGSRAATLTLHVTKLERRRGGAVELTLDGRLDEGLELHAEVTTFVRDVVTSAAMLRRGPLGDVGGMR